MTEGGGAGETANPLYALQGRRVGAHTLQVGAVQPGAFASVYSFRLQIQEHTIVSGLFYEGSRHIKPWLELEYMPRSGDERDPDGEALFQLLAELIPPGGHLSVAYLEHKITARALISGVPAPATPIGYLLWRCGCRWYKDWYFAEGWKEGGIKLQGEKPLTEERARKNTVKIVTELTAYLNKGGYAEPEIEAVCKALALQILDQVGAGQRS
ncbi:MAG TPA: DUF1122 domain-containing protein [Methanomicrobia archaeon]|nr:DUF1122 domain-containing protein [Methanomicrobia archaeon]